MADATKPLGPVASRTRSGVKGVRGQNSSPVSLAAAFPEQRQLRRQPPRTRKPSFKVVDTTQFDWPDRGRRLALRPPSDAHVGAAAAPVCQDGADIDEYNPLGELVFSQSPDQDEYNPLGELVFSQPADQDSGSAELSHADAPSSSETHELAIAHAQRSHATFTGQRQKARDQARPASAPCAPPPALQVFDDDVRDPLKHFRHFLTDIHQRELPADLYLQEGIVLSSDLEFLLKLVSRPGSSWPNVPPSAREYLIDAVRPILQTLLGALRKGQDDLLTTR